MIRSECLHDEYRRQLDRWAEEMAVGHVEITRGELDLNSSLSQVREFVSGNVDKRQQKIAGRCELLQPAIAELDRWIEEYTREMPSPAYDTAVLDAGRFLLWLDTHFELNAEQRDCVIAARSRLAVEERARHDRLAYARFDELLSIGPFQLESLSAGGDARMLLNPTSVWATFETSRFLDEEAELPAHVVFYAAEADVRTAVLERPAYDLVQLFANCNGCSYHALKRAVEPVMKEEELFELCSDLAGLGLLALE